MNRTPEHDQAVPENWLDLVNHRCDLDLAFEALEKLSHFHTDTIRGRIRSLQLRPKEAWKFFQRAEENADSFGASPRNLLRRFFLKVYCFENALLEESTPSGGDAERTKECIQSLLHGDTPPSTLASLLRFFCNGIYLLHREEYAQSKKIFLRLIKETSNRIGDEKTGFYFGASIAHRGLGEDEEADRQLENALLAIPTLETTFTMGLYAATASALLEIWGRDEEAREWIEFLTRLKLPKKTAEIFCERSRRMLERSASLKRVFIF